PNSSFLVSDTLGRRVQAAAATWAPAAYGSRSPASITRNTSRTGSSATTCAVLRNRPGTGGADPCPYRLRQRQQALISVFWRVQQQPFRVEGDVWLRQGSRSCS